MPLMHIDELDIVIKRYGRCRSCKHEWTFEAPMTEGERYGVAIASAIQCPICGNPANEYMPPRGVQGPDAFIVMGNGRVFLDDIVSVAINKDHEPNPDDK